MRVQNTKFVCTLGPASESPEILAKLMKAGMDVARLNFSHGSYENHALLIKRIRTAAKKVGVPLAIMQDLQGPKIRVGKIDDTKVTKGKEIVLTCGSKSDKKIPVQYKGLYKDVKKGSLLLIDDGLIELNVTRKKGKDIYCKVLNSGVIKANKGINVPNATITTSPITPKDKKDLKFGLTQDIDYVALSFVKEAKDIHNLRKLLGSQNVKIIAKIERREAVDNLKEIIEASDALMVARGDLAMEIGPEKVPVVQKEMIRLCNLAGKPVITATQMLASMVSNPTPTRAEVSDIANSIYDHSDGIMLSNETAVGKYPVRAVKMFAKVATEVESQLKKYDHLLPIRKIHNKNVLLDALGMEVCKLAEKTKSDKIIVVTEDDKQARYVSKHRSYVPTIVITKYKKTANQLALLWGINDIKVGKVTQKNYLKDIKKLLRKEKGKKVAILYTGNRQNHIVSTTL
ncbi:pyruvate kinase [Patescibacteria group bacterium]